MRLLTTVQKVPASVLTPWPCAQAVEGGNATWFGITVPFDITTLLGVVSVAPITVSTR